MGVVQLLLQDYGVVALVLILFLDGAGVPWPTEATLVLAGVAIRAGHLELPLVLASSLAGAAMGSALSYYLGRRMGQRLLQSVAALFRIGPQHLEKMDEWFVRYGEKAVFFGRFIPFVRNLVGYPAGITGIPFGKYMAFSLAGYAGYTTFALSLGWGGLSLAQVVEDPRVLLGLLVPLTLVVAWFKWGRKWLQK